MSEGTFSDVAVQLERPFILSFIPQKKKRFGWEHGIRKHTLKQTLPAKTNTSVRIRAVLSESS